MDGRFPFDATGGRGHHPQQLTAAQIRAALGLPAVDDIAAYLHHHQQQQQQERDQQLRQLILQEQLGHQVLEQHVLEQHVQEQQLRAIGEQLQDFPDLQQHYQNMLLSEQLNRQRDQVAQLRLQEELRRQQQHQQQLLLAATASNASGDDASASARAASPNPSAVPSFASVLRSQQKSPVLLQGQQHLQLQQQQPQQPAASSLASALTKSPNPAPATASSSSSTSSPKLASAGGTAPKVAGPPKTKVSKATPKLPASLTKGSSAKAAPKKQTKEKTQEPSLDGRAAIATALAKLEQQKQEKQTYLQKQQESQQHAQQQLQQQQLQARQQQQLQQQHAQRLDAQRLVAQQQQQLRDHLLHQQQLQLQQHQEQHERQLQEQRQQEQLQEQMKEHLQEKVKEHMQEQMKEQIQGKMQDEIVKEQAKEPPQPKQQAEVVHTVEKDTKRKAKRARKAPVEKAAASILRAASSESAMEVEEVDEEQTLAQVSRKSSMDVLTNASAFYGEVDEAAQALMVLLNSKHASDVQPNKKPKRSTGMTFSSDPDETIETPYCKSALPKLPSEPVDEDHMIASIFGSKAVAARRGGSKRGALKSNSNVGKANSNQKKKKKKKVSNVIEPATPVDKWYPKMSAVQQERRSAGENPDEDDFKDANPHSKFRKNDKVIRKRLSSSKEPGCIEKLPHCKLHHLRRQRDPNLASTPEFVFCSQVTDLYKDELMVCCSKCSTWRHVCCGGHFEGYSVRKTTKEPFVPICDFCYEETPYLEEYAAGAEKLQRQRRKHTRHAMATTAVIEAFSKQGEAIGAVGEGASDPKVVQAQHEQAQKDWAEMGQRMSKNRKSRAKEMEKLLVSVEDAELQRDRHNMINFLMRDTARKVPVGFENEFVNYFDPETVQLGKRAPTVETQCFRPTCNRQRRFDSLYCSDACGVSVLETDLMRSLVEAGQLHPSLLRA